MLCFSTELLLPTFVFLTRILCFGLYPMQIYLICHNFKHISTVSLSVLTSFNGVWYYEGDIVTVIAPQGESIPRVLQCLPLR